MDYMWLILAIATGPVGNLFFKAGMLRVGQSPQNFSKLPRFLLRTVSNPFVISAAIFVIVGNVTGAFALSIFPLSYFYPLAKAVPLVLVAVFCLLLFKEKVSGLGWLGIVTICVGVVLLGIAMG